MRNAELMDCRPSAISRFEPRPDIPHSALRIPHSPVTSLQIRFAMIPAARCAIPMIVSIGFTPEADGKTLASAT